jgi:very-short-patch-repair endonuclease
LAYLRPAIAAEWHPTKNGSLTPDKISLGANTIIWWKCQRVCPEGCVHEWAARVSDRVYKENGCPYCCLNRQKICIHQSIQYTHPKISAEWHPTLNGDSKSTMYSSGSEKSIWWKCKYNSEHTWKTAINNRVCNKTECPFCMNKTERKVFEYLTNMGLNVLRRFIIDECKRLRHLPFDICIPEYKVIVEIDGMQHFKTIRNWMPYEKAQKRDIFKMQKAEQTGYKVIRVFQEQAYRESESWLKENIYDEIVSDSRDHMFISDQPTLYDSHIELYERREPIILEN